MEEATRFRKSVLNAQVNFFFFLALLLLLFFSRRLFLNCLGDEFVGLTTTVGSLMGFLNLAELGVGTAMAYVLYAPLFRRDLEKLNELVSVLGFLYRRIGYVILAAGLVLACFLPWIFGKTGFEPGIVYFTYFAFLASVLVGYFVNYHITLLNADQRGYLMTVCFQSVNAVKLGLQMWVVWKTRSYVVWIAVELVAGVVYALILRRVVYRVYPWLKTDVRMGKPLLRKYPEITVYIRQVFAHRIGAFVLGKTDDLVIYGLVSLKMVAYYGNYVMIVAKVSQLADCVLGSVASGVGNLIAEGKQDNIRKVFWELMAVRYLIAGTLAFAVYRLITPFVRLWVGGTYVLGDTVLVLLSVNLFIMQARWAVDIFLTGYGLFRDVWAPCAEAALNLGISIVFARWWGIAGVMFGTTLSMLLIVCGWKPWFLYRRGFRTPLREYWLTVGKFLGLGGCAWAVCVFVLDRLLDGDMGSYGAWTVVAVKTTALFLSAYFALLYACSAGMRRFVCRIQKNICSFIRSKF